MLLLFVWSNPSLTLSMIHPASFEFKDKILWA